MKDQSAPRATSLTTHAPDEQTPDFELGKQPYIAIRLVGDPTGDHVFQIDSGAGMSLVPNHISQTLRALADNIDRSVPVE